MKSICILVAAGGTGGHLIPALEIARGLGRSEYAQRGGAVRVEFVGAGRPLEAKLIDAGGFRRHVIPIVGLKRRGLTGLIEFLIHLPRAVLATWRLISGVKPDVVVGVGGYISVLPVSIAAMRRIPTWIHEAELNPGLANSLLMRYASRVSLAFAQAKLSRSKGVEYTGHPVRREICEQRNVSRPQGDVPRRMLILGGSQGARSLDDAFVSLAGFLREKNIDVLHQARPERVAELSAAYERFQVSARVVPFIDDMACAYRWTDIVVGRSGASAVMEVEALNIPAIFVPYPHAAEQHQLANARVLADAGKALIVEEGDNFVSRLRHACEQLLDPGRYAAMRAAEYESRSLSAADRIAEGIIGIVRERKE